MQRFCKTFFSFFVCFCLMISAALAAPADELDALMKDMNKVNNGKANLEIIGQAMDYSFNITSELTFESRPESLIRGVVDIMTAPKGDMKKAKNTTYEFYAEDEGKQYAYYYTEKGKNKWTKEIVKDDEVTKEKDSAAVAIDAIDPNVFKDFTATVEYDGDFMSNVGRGDNTGYKITVDTAKFAKIISQIAMEGAKSDEVESIKMFETIGSVLPPASCVVVGNLKKGEIYTAHIPLTDFLRQSGQAIAGLNSLEPMTKMIVLAALQKAELDIKAEGFDYNNSKVEKLSDSVKKSAKLADKEKK